MRSPVDRRSEEDRRKAHHLDYLLNGGTERRSSKERRSRVERRSGWVRGSKRLSLSVRSRASSAGFLP